MGYIYDNKTPFSGVKALKFFTNVDRGCSTKTTIDMFVEMWDECPITALKVIMNLRDCREGKGEKKLVRIIMLFLKICKLEVYNKFVGKLFPELGSYKDLLFMCEYSSKYGLNYNHELQIFADQLKYDIEVIKGSSTVSSGCESNISFTAKWAPSEKTYYNKKELRLANKLANKLGMTPREYRKTLVNLRAHLNVVEVYMTTNKWELVNFSKIPLTAYSNYKEAFKRDHNKKGFITKPRKELKARYEKYFESKDRSQSGRNYECKTLQDVIRTYDPCIQPDNNLEIINYDPDKFEKLFQ